MRILLDNMGNSIGIEIKIGIKKWKIVLQIQRKNMVMIQFINLRKQ